MGVAESTEGILAFQHAVNHGAWCLWWPDVFHRINRRVAQALNHASCAEVKALLRKASKMFRISRAPFNSGRFGAEIQDARKCLLEAIQSGEAQELVEMWLHGVARDRNVSEDEFTVNQLVELLQKATRIQDVCCALRFCNLNKLVALITCIIVFLGCKPVGNSFQGSKVFFAGCKFVYIIYTLCGGRAFGATRVIVKT